MKNLFIGVDFSKEKVDVAIIFADGLTETAARMFNEFKTTVSGYKQLVKWVEQNSYGIDSSLWLFCGENTGDYSKGLCNFLYGKGYDMWLENAKSIWRCIRSQTIEVGPRRRLDDCRIRNEELRQKPLCTNHLASHLHNCANCFCIVRWL